MTLIPCAGTDGSHYWVDQLASSTRCVDSSGIARCAQRQVRMRRSCAIDVGRFCLSVEIPEHKAFIHNFRHSSVRLFAGRRAVECYHPRNLVVASDYHRVVPEP